MSHIIVKNLINSNIAVSMPLGDKLYKELIKVWDENNTIKIDFINIDTYATPFFNASIGRLLKDHTIDELKQKLSFEHLSEGGRNLLNRVISNAISFYENPEPIIQLVNTNVEE
ncbi:STAS-like domain-containing protein [Avibacterium avium]|uniref:STAS-like domain-containing protein n=1 Tax=Avibacterium avium TaxID=751 RepID=UPI003BF78523